MVASYPIKINIIYSIAVSVRCDCIYCMYLYTGFRVRLFTILLYIIRIYRLRRRYTQSRTYT